MQCEIPMYVMYVQYRKLSQISIYPHLYLDIIITQIIRLKIAFDLENETLIFDYQMYSIHIELCSITNMN